MGDATQLLAALRQGDRRAADDLMPLIYDELRRLAARKMAAEPTGQTLQATALVHEAYLRLVNSDAQTFENRQQFFASAAEAMRRILIEHARRRKTLKRGGQFKRRVFAEAAIPAGQSCEDLLALNDALQKLAETDDTLSTLVKLRYFVGLTIPEAADVLGLPKRSTDRLWAYARAWLHREIQQG